MQGHRKKKDQKERKTNLRLVAAATAAGTSVSLTLFILLFLLVATKSDHRFLGLSGFLRSDKTVITATGNRRLCLTCNKKRKMLLK